MGKWANGQMGRWANGQMGKWAKEAFRPLVVLKWLLGHGMSAGWKPAASLEGSMRRGPES
jgi:hypothetical protein